MLEDFGLYEQANLKKSLSEGLNNQWNKAFDQAGSAIKKAKSGVYSLKEIEVSADRAAKTMKEEKRSFPDRRTLVTS